MNLCFSCKKELKIRERPGRHDVCPFCSADLKACMNCRFYDEGAYNSCREPRAERVVEKNRANFCEYFEFMDSQGDIKKESPEEARRKLEEIFGKK